MVETIQKLAWYFAARMTFYHPYMDVGDMVGVGIAEALRVLPQWDRAKGKLTTFIGPRVQGAMQDAIRLYSKSRNRGVGYRDHRTTRFGRIEAAVDGPIDDILPGGERPVSRLELLDELAWVRRRVTRQEWLILILRFGAEHSQRHIAATLGLTGGRVSQIETNLRQRFNLGPAQKSGKRKFNPRNKPNANG